AEVYGGQPFLSGVAFAPNGRWLAAANGQTLSLWDVKSRKLGWQAPADPKKEAHFTGMAFAPDSRTLATCGHGRIGVFDVASCKKFRELFGGYGSDHSFAVAFSPDGKQLVSGHGYNWIGWWDPIKGAFLRRTGLLSNDGIHAVYGLAFAPGGKTLAAAGGWNGSNVLLWDTATDKIKRRFLGQPSWVRAVSYSPEGRCLASAGDGAVRLWEVASGKQRVDFPIPRGTALAVAFSPDGRYLASVHRDGTALVWDVL